jgi:mRNA-degrading endonuclease HigB of HigAB toxin-antitoxin module
LVAATSELAAHAQDLPWPPNTRSRTPPEEMFALSTTMATTQSPIDLLRNCAPGASILKSDRVVFNIEGNHYRLVTLVGYQGGVLMIRFFGSHDEYDQIDAGTV